MPEVKVTCPTCSAVIPLTEGIDVRCPHCATIFSMQAAALPEPDNTEAVNGPEGAPDWVTEMAAAGEKGPAGYEVLSEADWKAAAGVEPEPARPLAIPVPAARLEAIPVPVPAARPVAIPVSVLAEEVSQIPKLKPLQEHRPERNPFLVPMVVGAAAIGLLLIGGVLWWVNRGPRATKAESVAAVTNQPSEPVSTAGWTEPVAIPPSPEPQQIEPGSQSTSIVQPPADPKPDMPAVPEVTNTDRTPPTPEKRPVPDAAAQAKAEAEIKDFYKADYAKRKPTEMFALGEKLALKAAAINDNPATRFVLYREARDLAAKSGEAIPAMKVIDVLAKEFTIEPLEMKLESLDLLLRSMSGNLTSNQVVCDLAVSLAEEALAWEKFELADKLLKVAQSAALRAKGASRITLVQNRLKEAEGARKQHEAAVQAYETLTKDPYHAEANLTLGRHLCFVKGIWDKGLPMLVVCSDNKLKKLSGLDLSAPKDANEQVAVGDAWWDYAEREKGMVKLQVQRRAAFWYGQAVDGVTGLTTDRILKRLRVVHEDSPVPVGEIRRYAGHAAAFSPDGRRLVYAGNDHVLRLCDVVTNKEMCRFEGHTGDIVAIAFSRDGRRFASSGTDKLVRLWDAETGKELRRLDAGTAGSYKLLLSADGRQLITADLDRNLHVWDLNTNRELKRIGYQNGRPVRTVLAITPDGLGAIVGGYTRQFHVYDLSSGKEVRRGSAQCVLHDGALTADGRFALAGGSDANLWLWEVASCTRVACMKGHTGDVLRAAFSPDSKWALSGGADTTVRLWRLSDSKEVYCFTGHRDRVEGVAFSPDGVRAVSWGKDNVVYLLGLPKNE